jgi:hypothetical protein
MCSNEIGGHDASYRRDAAWRGLETARSEAPSVADTYMTAKPRRTSTRRTVPKLDDSFAPCVDGSPLARVS